MKNIVTFEQTVGLKGIGYNEISNSSYVGYTKNGKLVSRRQYSEDREYQIIPCWIKSPTVSEALQWIRDNKGIACSVNLDQMMQDRNVRTYYVGFFIKDPRKISFGEFTSAFDTYPESESELLNVVINYLEKSSGIRN